MVRYNVAIIGAGPGGYVAALKAAKTGLKTALIEADEVGGVCLNRGCIPTKSIIASVNQLRKIRAASEIGVLVEKVDIDYPKIISRKNNTVANLVKGIHQLIKGYKIDYIHGYASLRSNCLIEVQSTQIEADNIIIATGSSWREIPGLERDGKFILSSDDILNIDDIPGELAIVGGGAIGCEFASIFSALGTKVTIIEVLSDILPMEDKTTSKILTRFFKKQGISVLTNTRVESTYKEGAILKIALSNGDQLKVNKILVSIGRKPNITGFGLEALGVAIENGNIVTDESLLTNIPNVYAIGDVNGKYMLAHAASQEGIVAVENIMGKKTKMNYSAIPRPIYTYPEISCVGATETELVKTGKKFKVGRFAYGAIPKAICDNATDGQILIYAEDGSERILGAQIIGDHATEITAELTLAIQNRLCINDLVNTIHSHPTLSEIVKEACEDCNSQAIHKIYT